MDLPQAYLVRLRNNRTLSNQFMAIVSDSISAIHEPRSYEGPMSPLPQVMKCVGCVESAEVTPTSAGVAS